MMPNWSSIFHFVRGQCDDSYSEELLFWYFPLIAVHSVQFGLSKTDAGVERGEYSTTAYRNWKSSSSTSIGPSSSFMQQPHLTKITNIIITKTTALVTIETIAAVDIARKKSFLKNSSHSQIIF